VNLEDHIRQFVMSNYIQPARCRQEDRIVLQVGDVHRAMGLAANQPEVARVLGDVGFEEYAGVRLLRRIGPHMGAELVFTFAIQTTGMRTIYER
jgi:hypothetical protein